MTLGDEGPIKDLMGDLERGYKFRHAIEYAGVALKYTVMGIAVGIGLGVGGTAYMMREKPDTPVSDSTPLTDSSVKHISPLPEDRRWSSPPTPVRDFDPMEFQSDKTQPQVPENQPMQASAAPPVRTYPDDSRFTRTYRDPAITSPPHNDLRQNAPPNGLLPLKKIPNGTNLREIPEGYLRVTTRVAGQWLMPLDLERIDRDSIPKDHSVMVKGRNPALIEDRDRAFYENSGYRDLFKRLEPIEPPKDTWRASRRVQKT